jgi:hypothetical protein
MRLIHRLFLLALITVSHIFLWGQSEQLIVPNNSPYCLNKKTNEFVVFENEHTYYTKPPSAKSWQQHAYTFIGDNTTFDAFKESFRPITLSNGRLFFVYKGIGEVYELMNDTLRRVDHSFKHENQFFHSLFEHNNRIYAFGGYGLFTFKNILVYFDDVSKEWFEVITPIKPPVRGAQFFQYNNGVFYIFGGGFSEGLHQIYRYDCWGYYFKTKQWKKIGDVNLDFYRLHLQPGAIYEHLPLDVFFNYPSIQLVDIQKNNVNQYENTKINHIKFALFDRAQKHLLLEKTAANKMMLYTIALSSVQNTKIATSNLFTRKIAIPSLYWLFIPFLVVLLIIYFFIIKKRSKISLQPSDKLVIRIKNNNIFIGERMINTELTLLEFRILKKFIELKDTPIDIVALNELFEDENTSHAAQKKRRETTLKTLREKLAFILDISQENVFLESRDKADKRIKMFLINPDILA